MEKYKVTSSTFLGCEKYSDNHYSYKYELTFNRSLEHTGRFQGIEDGLNRYVRREKWQNFFSSFINLFRK